MTLKSSAILHIAIFAFTIFHKSGKISIFCKTLNILIHTCIFKNMPNYLKTCHNADGQQCNSALKECNFSKYLQLSSKF